MAIFACYLVIMHFLSDPPFCYVTRPAPKNEDEMMVAIFEYIDR